jgi:hypothetical protein
MTTPLPYLRLIPSLLLLAAVAVVRLQASPTTSGEAAAKAISFSQLGAEADKSGGEAASTITPVAGGARLRAVMQDLEAEATADGLWLISTADEDAGKENRFRVRAVAVGRAGLFGAASAGGWRLPLAERGSVVATKDAAAWVRPGLVEEYSVGTDGVRQDFVLFHRPFGGGDGGELVLDLEVTGARAETAAFGTKLTLEANGRELAYSRLKVTDATGRELTARMETLSPAHLRFVVDDTVAAYPVRIDPTFSDADWVALNTGIAGASNPVNALAVDDRGTLYVGGDFTGIGTVAANRIAKWDGSAWVALGPGMDGSVNALAVSGGDLYVGGDFTTAGGVSARSLAKWNGSAWSALGSGIDGDVLALAVSGGDLYAGGRFNTAGGVLDTSYIAKWDGSGWSALGSGMNGSVNALAVSGGDLYVGGAFTAAGGVSANRIAKWNGSAWSALGSGMNSFVHALAVSGGDLYAGGRFNTAGGVGANHIAKWNGNAWSAFGSGTRMNNSVNALALSGGDLYAGGLFTTAGGVPGTRHIAKWDGSAWSTLGSGMDGSVYALAVSGGDLYVGGDFTIAGGVRANKIAKWNGSAWSALGSGMDGGDFLFVLSLAVDGGDLYAGGTFTTAGGVPGTRYIAKWNGSEWSALGSGMDRAVRALAVDAGNLYAGGIFTTAGGVPGTRHIAKWNGSAWSGLGSGMSGGISPAIHVLAVDEGAVYVGGEFTSAGGVSANSIAKWNGSAWSAVGSGMDGLAYVYALAVCGGDLYAGGRFNTAGGVPGTRNIAKWDGSEWLALGSGMDGAVFKLAVGGEDLYVGGRFGTVDGVSANNIAKWDGSAWSSLGSGMNDSVSALAVDAAGHLFVGGDFVTAGTTFSPFIAQANLNGTPPVLVLPETTLVKNADTLEFGYARSVASVTAGTTYAVEWSDTMAIGSWSMDGVTQSVVSTVGDVQTMKATLSAGAGGNRHVRLRMTAP